MKIRTRVTAFLLLECWLLSLASGKYLNTACEVTTDCGLGNHLQCINNVCQCDRRTQIYDQSTQKCLLLAGQQCKIGTQAVTGKNGQYQYPTIWCVPHADCTKSVCRCNTGYRSSQDSLCKPDFGTRCHANDNCDESLGLICTRGICQCFNSSWDYQNQFGCVHPKDPTYLEMLTLLNQTESLLKENNVDLNDILYDLASENDPSMELILGNDIAERRQDTYNTNDLIFAAQMEDAQTTESGSTSSRFSLRGIREGIAKRIRMFRMSNFVKRIRTFFRGSPGGYPEAMTTTIAPSYGPPPATTYGPPPTGYGAPGTPEMGAPLRMGRFNMFLRNLRMRYMKFVQNIRKRFRGGGGDPPATTAAAPADAPPPAADPPPPPPAPEIKNPPPTVIQSSGNFQNNPIFDNENGNADQPNEQTQGQGTNRFIMRSRERFRNLLRGNLGGGGYSYAPPSKEADAPAEPPPAEAGEAPAGSSNYFTNSNVPPSRPNNLRAQQQQFSSSFSSQTQISAGSSLQRHERQPSRNTGKGPNPQSFFGRGAQSLQQQTIRQLQQQDSQGFAHLQFPRIPAQKSISSNDNIRAPSKQQNVIVPKPVQIQNQPLQFQRPPPANQPPSIYSNSKLNREPDYSNSNIGESDYSHSNNQELDYSNSNPREPDYSPVNNEASSYSRDEESLSFQVQKNNRPPSIRSHVTTASPIPRFRLPVPAHENTPTLYDSLPQNNFNNILSEASETQPGFAHYPPQTPEEPDTDTYKVQNQQSYRNVPRFERIDDADVEEEEDERPKNAAQSWRETF